MFLLGKLGGAALYEFRALGYEKDFFHMSEEFMKWTNNVRNGRPHHLSYMQGQGLYIGLRSSFSFCWTLTQYHLYTDDEWLEDGITKQALSKAEKLMNTGKNLVRDHELAARISVMLCQWGRAVTLYPETMTAAMVRTQCDTYKDYQ